MAAIESKSDLVGAMVSMGACKAAMEWVGAQQGSAREIWMSCTQHGWLVWFAGRRNQNAIVEFAQRCGGLITQDGPYKTSVSSLRVGDGTLREQCTEAVKGACAAMSAEDATGYARLAASIAVMNKCDTEHAQLACMHDLWPVVSGEEGAE